MVGLAGSRFIPKLQSADEQGQQSALAQAECFTTGIVLIVPHPAHRSVAVANMDGLGRSANSLGVSRRTGDDQIVCGEIERTHGEGVQKEIKTVVVPNPRQVLHPRSPDLNVLQPWRHAAGQRNGREQRRIGKHGVQLFRNLLGPAELRKIIVYDSDSHFTLHHAKVLNVRSKPPRSASAPWLRSAPECGSRGRATSRRCS